MKNLLSKLERFAPKMSQFCFAAVSREGLHPYHRAIPQDCSRIGGNQAPNGAKSFGPGYFSPNIRAKSLEHTEGYVPCFLLDLVKKCLRQNGSFWGKSTLNANSRRIAASNKNKLSARLVDLISDEGGAFIPIFAISIMAVFLSTGAAIDYAQLSRARTIVNNSLDAAVLAAGNEYIKNEPTDAQLRSVFEDHFYANLASSPELMNNVAIKSFNFDRAKEKVSAEVTSPVQMAFMGLIGKPEIPVNVVTEAKFSSTPVEISMVLDVTGSMNWAGKLGSLKLAARDAVDILLPKGRPNTQVRIGLVPYSEGVRLNENMALKVSGQDHKTCMTERTSNPHNDVSYSREYVSVVTGARCTVSKVEPLTNNASKLKSRVASLTASGATAGHLGIAWGYYMLSENWQNLWPNNSKPSNYAGNTKKVVILMTDGSFNTYFRGHEARPRGTWPTVAASNSSAKRLCADMKADKAGKGGIEIYSIAFNAPANARATLQNCASADTARTTYYYDATNEKELRTAFREIAESIRNLRLTR